MCCFWNNLTLEPLHTSPCPRAHAPFTASSLEILLFDPKQEVIERKDKKMNNVKTDFGKYTCVLGSNKRVNSHWVLFWVTVIYICVKLQATEQEGSDDRVIPYVLLSICVCNGLRVYRYTHV